MRKTLFTATVIAGLCSATMGTQALPPTPTAITECTNGYAPAFITATATVSTNFTGCPILEDEDLRKLVDRNLTGSEFAYPAVPGTCLSGIVTGGTVMTKNKTIQVTGTTESAQRFFPEALSVNPSRGGVFMIGATEDGIPFASGAAATIVSLEGVDSDFNLKLVLSDRFTLKLDEFPIRDTEDLEVVGSDKGKATGRLTGIAFVEQFPPDPIQNAQFDVEGQICIK